MTDSAQINTAPAAKPSSSENYYPANLVSLGRIAAGSPIEAIEDRRYDELLNLLTLPGRQVMRVSDDSLIDAGILCGDNLVVQSQQHANSGDIVIAMVDSSQLMVKRIRWLAADGIQLIADNPNSDDITLPLSRVTIEGKVVAQIRRYG